jgi:iron donor protein CyaY
MMDEQQFKNEADRALTELHRSLMDAGDEHGFDSDMNSGALTVEFENGTRFVVSPNAPVRQVWVSALMKSYKLDWNEQKRAFTLTDSGATLSELLASTITQQLGQPVTL